MSWNLYIIFLCVLLIKCHECIHKGRVSSERDVFIVIITIIMMMWCDVTLNSLYIFDLTQVILWELLVLLWIYSFLDISSRFLEHVAVYEGICRFNLVKTNKQSPSHLNIHKKTSNAAHNFVYFRKKHVYIR